MRPRPSVLVGVVLGPLAGAGLALALAVPPAWGATAPAGTGSPQSALSALGSSLGSSLGPVLAGVGGTSTGLVLAPPRPVTLGAVATPAATTGSGQVQAQAAGPTLTVTPDSGLTDGQSVTVSGSGYSANSAGGMAECNNEPNQPTVSVLGNAVPVGCTNPLNSLQSTSSSGTFSASFTVHTGTIGPPSQGTDSSGGSASADAAKYPCPPTAAQLASGDTCGISYGDASGHQATADITFASQGSPGSATTTGGNAAPGTVASASSGAGGASTSASGASSASSASSASGSTSSSGSGGSASSGGGASSGSTGLTGSSSGGSGALPFTGFGMGMRRLTFMGVVLAAAGTVMMALGRRFRRAHSSAAPASSG